MQERRGGRGVSRQIVGVMMTVVAALAGTVSLTASYWMTRNYESQIKTAATEQDKTLVMNVIASLKTDIFALSIAAAAVAAFVFVVIVRRKISKPIRELADAAEKISRGELDAEIRYAPDSGAEIAVIASAFNRMTEQLRVHAIKETQAQSVAAVRLQFGLFVREAQSVSQAFKMTLAVLRCQYEPLKITAVYANPNPLYSLAYDKDHDGDAVFRESDGYHAHAEVAALIADKQILYYNAFAIKEQNIGFVLDNANAVCIVPLAGKGKPLGYIILESVTGDGISISAEESFLIETANELSAWLMSHKDASLSFAASAADADKGGNRVLAALREFEDLDVDAALEAMGGFEDLYEKTARLFAKLLPETVKKMDEYLRADMAAFAIEIHGVKGSLNNIGSDMGRRASWIEKAAKSGDAAYCEEAYPRFRELLLSLHERLTDALPDRFLSGASKKTGGAKFLSERLDAAKNAAESFDTFKAKDVMREIAEFAYSPKTDKTLGEISAALDRFDCETAVQLILKYQSNVNRHEQA